MREAGRLWRELPRLARLRGQDFATGKNFSFNRCHTKSFAFCFGKLFYKSNRKLFSCVCIAWYKHSRRWENSRLLCKPSTLTRVCITVSNSPNPSRVYIRLCKHGKRFLLLKCKMTVTKITFDPTCHKPLRVVTLGLKCTIHVINDVSNTSSKGRPQPSIKRRSHVFPVVALASARPNAKLPIKQWIFYPHANKPHFYKKGVALRLVMKVRVFETSKMAYELSYVSYIYRVYLYWREILGTVLEESCSSASQKCSEQKKVKMWIRFL